jgi:hypothetical protein
MKAETTAEVAGVSRPQSDIDRGLADFAERRFKDFDQDGIVEQGGKLLASQRFPTKSP